MKEESIIGIKAERRQYKNALIQLTETIVKRIAIFDLVMKEPTSETKGKKLAALIGQLEFANDSAMHFGLNYSFPKIKKIKALSAIPIVEIEDKRQ
jgi:hypothetical protein